MFATDAAVYTALLTRKLTLVVAQEAAIPKVAALEAADSRMHERRGVPEVTSRPSWDVPGVGL